MLRLSVFAIGLTLAIGPNASSLCRAWCAEDSVPRACHPALACPAQADGCCDVRAAGLAAVPTGESRQGVDPSGEATGVVPLHAAIPANEPRLRDRHGPPRPIDTRIVTVLRI